jgi:hypothetical protein
MAFPHFVSPSVTCRSQTKGNGKKGKQRKGKGGREGGRGGAVKSKKGGAWLCAMGTKKKKNIKGQAGYFSCVWVTAKSIETKDERTDDLRQENFGRHLSNHKRKCVSVVCMPIFGL